MTMKPTIHTIITHPGMAHQDDLLAVSVLLALYPDAELERRPPTEDELADWQVAIVDIGQQYDPALNNFDHHQWDAGEACPCSASLVLEHYTGLQRGHHDGPLYDCFPQLKFVDRLDNHGPKVVAEGYTIPNKVDPKGYAEQVSRITDMVYDSAPMPTQFLLDAFTRHNHLPWVRPCLTEMGTELLRKAKAYTEAVNRINNEPPVMHEIPGRYGCIATYDDELSQVERQALAQYLDKTYPGGVAVVASHDDRGPGWSCVQHNHNKTMDTTKLAKDPRVLFAHKGGFIMKTKEELSIEEVVDLIREAC